MKPKRPEELARLIERVVKGARSIAAANKSVGMVPHSIADEAFYDDLNQLDDLSVELKELAETPRNILQRADEITGAGGARREAYQHPAIDFECTAGLLSAVLSRASCTTGTKPYNFHFTGRLPKELIPLIMICVKLSRLSGQLDHEDSALDIAGYSRTLEMLWEWERERQL